MFNNSSAFQDKNGAYCGTGNNPVAAKVLKTIIYFLLFVAALVGNTFIAIIVYKTRQMRTTTNYLIVNVSTSDAFFAVVTMPLMINFIYAEEHLLVGGFLAQVICKLVPFLQSSTVSTSTLSLTLIAFDRFFAIMMPLKTIITKQLARILIGTIWFVSFVMNSPILYANTAVTNSKTTLVYCKEIWEPLFNTEQASKAYTVYLFVLFYLLPIATMTILYSTIVYDLWRGNKAMEHRNKISFKEIHKANKKVLFMFITVVIFFALFWLPVYIYQFNFFFGRDGCAVPHFVIFVGFTFAHATSAINPFIYCIFSENYRKGFSRILRNCISSATEMRRRKSSSTVAERRAVELYAL